MINAMPGGPPIGEPSGWRSSIAAGARRAQGEYSVWFGPWARQHRHPVGAPSTYRQEPGERGNKFHSASRLWRSNIEPKSTPLPPPPLRLEKHFPPSPPHQLPSAQKRFIVCRLALLFLPPYERAWILVIWRSFRRPSRTWTPGIVPYLSTPAATD